MVRKGIYAFSFVFTLFSTSLNLLSLNRLDWVTYKAPDSLGLPLKTQWGLFETCDFGPNGQRQCRDFPSDGIDCTIPEKDPNQRGIHRPFTFCDSWRTAGYVTQLAAVFGCAALLVHVIIVARGRHFRNHGWKILVGFILANALCQILAMAFVVHLVRTDRAVFPHTSHVTKGFIMSQVSWGTDILLFSALLAAGIYHTVTGSKDGYREIPSKPKRRSRRFSDDEQGE